jgi:hypothetical protein
LDKEEDLIHKKKMSLLALQGLLSNAKIQRPGKSDETSKIENALMDVEDMENYVEKFNDLDQLVVTL